MPTAVAPDSDTSWKLQVAERLGGIERTLIQLLESVKHQNTATETNAGKIAVLEANQQARKAADEATEKATAPWRRWAERAAVVAITIAAVIVLKNADTIIKLFIHG
jgi:hypothetical protein